MEKKDNRIDIIVLIVMFVSALLVIVSVTGLFFEGYTGDVFTGSSIMLGHARNFADLPDRRVRGQHSNMETY